MNVILEILSYLTGTGFVFVSLCAMTRGGRGGFWRFAALGALGGVDVLMEWLWRMHMPFDLWLSVFFLAAWSVVFASVFAFSRDSPGRRLFLAIDFGAYAAFCLSAFHAVAYRNVFSLPYVRAVAAGLAVVVAATLGFVFWVLPKVPRDGRDFSWKGPCFAALAQAAMLYVCGFWPISIVTAPARFCAPFALASLFAWIGFPLIYRFMNDRLRTAAAERQLELMTAEMKVRRAAIDEARRLRHDQRFHRVQLGEYLLKGQYEKAVEYLGLLEDEASGTPTDKLVWCENETVNAILSGASRKAAAKGVALTAELDVSRQLPVSDVDLVAVVANLVDNAIEGVGGGEGEGEGEGEGVHVTVRQHENGIGISVSNPVPDGFALSSEGLPCERPGTGLESVGQTVRRHRGDWQYTLEDGVLTCRLMMRFVS